MGGVTACLLCAGIPDMRTALLVGGLPLANQLHRLRTGVQVGPGFYSACSNCSLPPGQVVVATPARLLDILENHGRLYSVIVAGDI